MNQEQQLQAIRERWRKVSEFPGNHNEYPLANHNSLGEGVTVFVTPKYVGVTEHIRKMPDDIATLLHMVEERDAIIHDLQLDGSALARRAVEEFSRSFLDHVRRDWPAWESAIVRHMATKLSGLPAPDPLPPDQARQEAERLRKKLRAIQEEIEEWENGISSHTYWAGDGMLVLASLKRLIDEDTP